MALLTEPNATLKREDVADEFTLVDQHSCPMVTTIAKGPKPESMLSEYPVDAYDAPALGGRPDGKDVQTAELFNGTENTAKLASRGQWFHKAVGVGKIANRVPNLAGTGKGKVYSRAVMKKLVELKRSMEYTFLSIQDSGADNGTVGSLTRGIGSWLQAGAQADQPVPAAFRPLAAQNVTVATAPAFTEAQLRGILQAQWDQTGSKDLITVPCRSSFQAVITDFMNVQTQSATVLPIRRFTHSSDAGTMELRVDRYVGDFGECAIFPVKFIDDTNAIKMLAYFLHLDRWQTRVDQAPEHEELPNGGGGKKGQIDAILHLACLNPRAEARVALV